MCPGFARSPTPLVRALVALLVAACVACSTPVDDAPPAAPPPAAPPAVGEPEAWSLAGRALYPTPLPDDVRRDREAAWEAAHAAYRESHGDIDAIVWLGRRTAYLGRHREAIEIYTAGLELYPDSHVLLRHRGHRYVTVRRLDDAIADLERATTLIADRPDEVEPDGLPNARNVPTSTSHSNVWYHLGLAYYLKGDFDNAQRCYRECMRFSTNPDMLCATTHWLYMTLRRLGREAEAAALLEPIHADMDVIENHAYHELLLLYRGERTPDELLPADGADSIESATTGYGVANWHLYNGRADEARALLERIVAGKEWAAFGYLAAEAELGRSAG